MLDRDSIVAVALTALSLTMTGASSGALAHDESKYPDWSGQWLRVLDGGPPRYDTTKPIRNRTATNSWFASADLDYKSIIFLTLTARKDWFSTLSPKSNSITYPAIGASFILSDAVTLPSWVNYAKLRASWAQVGGATPDPYILNQTYSSVQGGHLGQPARRSRRGGDRLDPAAPVG